MFQDIRSEIPFGNFPAEEQGKLLELLCMGQPCSAPQAKILRSLFDLSLLRHRESDDVVGALRLYQRKVQYDMAKTWDVRCRRRYGERFDFARNLVGEKHSKA